MKKNIGFIGYGNMGACIAEALSPGLWDVYAYDIAMDKIKASGITPKSCVKEILKTCEVIVLAIKPQEIKNFLIENGPDLNHSSSLIISIAAGVSTSFFERTVPGIKIVRVMPNLAAKVKKSISFIYPGQLVSEAELRLAKNVFDSIGYTSVLKNEDLMDSVTALSGSGPGFVFYFFESLQAAAVNELGFSQEESHAILTRLLDGCAALINNSGDSFADWKNKVCSKGGTTQAGIDVWSKGRFDKLTDSALNAAKKRAAELNIKE